MIAQRGRERPDGSYTARLLAQGARREPQEDRRGSDGGRAGREGRDATSAWPRSAPTSSTTCSWCSSSAGAADRRCSTCCGRRRRAGNEGARLRRLRAALARRAGSCPSSARSRPTCSRRCPRSWPSPRGAERAFLLESVVGGERVARYSFLGRDPVATIEAHGQRRARARTPEGTRRVAERPPRRAARARWAATAAEVPGPAAASRAAPSAISPTTRSGSSSASPTAIRRTARPLASFSFYRSLVAFDHVRQRLVLIADAEPGRARRLRARRRNVLDALEEDLRGFRAADRRREGGAPRPSTPSLADGAGLPEAVRRAKEYIAAGDIFQVVLSRQAHGALRRSTPSRSTARCAW